MKPHLEYLGYIIRHKYFVFVAGLKVGAPVWRLIIHDWTKFLPSEWFPYVKHFYDCDKNAEIMEAFAIYDLVELAPWGFLSEDRFNGAWLLHQKRNKHHWQYWHGVMDTGDSFLIPMPEKYVREMVADWAGAGRAITGKWEVAAWYKKNSPRIRLRDHSPVERLISKHFPLESSEPLPSH